MNWCARPRAKPTIDICCGTTRKEHTVTIDVPEASRQKLIMCGPRGSPARRGGRGQRTLCRSAIGSASGRGPAGRSDVAPVSPLHCPAAAGSASPGGGRGVGSGMAGRQGGGTAEQRRVGPLPRARPRICSALRVPARCWASAPFAGVLLK